MKQTYVPDQKTYSRISGETLESLTGTLRDQSPTDPMKLERATIIHEAGKLVSGDEFEVGAYLEGIARAIRRDGDPYTYNVAPKGKPAAASKGDKHVQNGYLDGRKIHKSLTGKTR